MFVVSFLLLAFLKFDEVFPRLILIPFFTINFNCGTLRCIVVMFLFFHFLLPGDDNRRDQRMKEAQRKPTKLCRTMLNKACFDVAEFANLKPVLNWKLSTLFSLTKTK